MPHFLDAARAAVLACLLPTALAAQAPDSNHAVHIPVTDSALRIPADRVSDLVAWVAGGGLDETGTPTWHGLPVARGEWTIDGVRWASGLRSTGVAGLGPLPVRLEPAFNSLANAELSPSAIGPVTLGLTTLGAGDRWDTHGSSETGAPFRPDGGTGDSRFEIATGGPLGHGFRLQLGGTLAARQAASGGVGYASAPYYLATGTDTTMVYQAGPDSITAPVQKFTPSTKVPYTPRSTADWTARLDGRIGAAKAWAHWIGTREAEGLFQYQDAFNPAQITGMNQQGYDVAAGIDAPLGGHRLTVAVALQHERSEQGPLTYPGQLDTRDAGAGLMLSGVDLRWDMTNFPIDDQLITDFRANTPGSRRSPYDLENPTQYALSDQYRNSPYATQGWNEGGGPVTRLRFYDDRRFVASAAVTQDQVMGGTVTLGIDVIHHDARLYSFFLTDEQNSNIWIEHPNEAAATIAWVYRGASWRLDAGVRVDRFASGGERPYLRVTDPAEADYGKYIWFPRGGAAAAVSDSDVHWIADQAHTAAAPHALLAAVLAPGWEGHLQAQRSAVVPDFADLYDGINADLGFTGSGAAFGRDVGHEITDHFEAGVDRRGGAWHVAATYFEDHYKQVVVTRQAQFYDPVVRGQTYIFTHPMIDGPAIKGAELSARADLSARLAFTGSYTHLSTDDVAFDFGAGPQEESPLRRHSLMAAARLTAPDHGLTAGLATLVTFRIMSGLAQATDLNGVPTDIPGVFRSTAVPAWRSLDLRLVKGVIVGGRHATVYVDGRNLLNAANLLHAFPTGDPHGSNTAQESAWRVDSASWAVEANKNGVYAGGTIDLRFSGAGRGGCGSWLESSGAANPPNCAYLIAAEQRFGDGDGMFTIAEQRAASTSSYLTRDGPGAFSGPSRAIRAGVELTF